MLASDLNNTEYVGAKDPDSGLFVEFYFYEPVDAWASQEKSIEAQRRVVVKLPKQPFVRIMVPGDKTSEWTGVVSEAHKQRFPRQWMAWQISEGLVGGEEDIPGWKLSEWGELSQDQLHELMYLRFQTVEQLAGASDKQIQGIGMGGLALRDKARVGLRNKMGAETKAALDAKDAEMEDMRGRLARMEALLGAVPAPDVVIVPEPDAVVVEKRGPGRPPKQPDAQVV